MSKEKQAFEDVDPMKSWCFYYIVMLDFGGVDILRICQLFFFGCLWRHV